MKAFRIQKIPKHAFPLSQQTKEIKRINTWWLFNSFPPCKNKHACPQICLYLVKYSCFLWCCVLFHQINQICRCACTCMRMCIRQRWIIGLTSLPWMHFSAFSALSYPSFWLWRMLQMCRVFSSENKVFIPSYHFIGMASLVIFGPAYRNRRKLNDAHVSQNPENDVVIEGMKYCDSHVFNCFAESIGLTNLKLKKKIITEWPRCLVSLLTWG